MIKHEENMLQGFVKRHEETNRLMQKFTTVNTEAENMAENNVPEIGMDDISLMERGWSFDEINAAYDDMEDAFLDDESELNPEELECRRIVEEKWRREEIMKEAMQEFFANPKRMHENSNPRLPFLFRTQENVMGKRPEQEYFPGGTAYPEAERPYEVVFSEEEQAAYPENWVGRNGILLNGVYGVEWDIYKNHRKENTNSIVLDVTGEFRKKRRGGCLWSEIRIPDPISILNEETFTMVETALVDALDAVAPKPSTPSEINCIREALIRTMKSEEKNMEKFYDFLKAEEEMNNHCFPPLEIVRNMRSLGVRDYKGNCIFQDAKYLRERIEGIIDNQKWDVYYNIFSLGELPTSIKTVASIFYLLVFRTFSKNTYRLYVRGDRLAGTKTLADIYAARENMCIFLSDKNNLCSGFGEDIKQMAVYITD